MQSDIKATTRKYSGAPKRFLTRAAPTPTNISSNSAPEQKKNGTPASPATALANNVLPVPGAPTSRIPR